ncbi:MAG: hypothetical protein CTY31_12360 [Hyphomicrobium sp.]|nr:MAG: hypothetical protein CTY39_11990 [Hyphomicrobium sp.]PPC98805.1 MAG: hypothetical protein CTY31_12360 [Hyphomicrobium sp.]
MTGEPTSMAATANLPPQSPVSAPAGLGESVQSGAQEQGSLSPAPVDVDAKKVEQLISFADFHHQYVGQYIQLADAKAGATFAVTSGLTAFLLNAPGYIDALKFGVTFPVSILAVLAFILLNVSSAISFFVIVPRLPSGGDSHIFWKSVAQLPNGPEYVRRIGALSDTSLAVERISNSYNLSVVCSRKYLLLRRAMLIAALALFTTLLYWLVGGLWAA